MSDSPVFMLDMYAEKCVCLWTFDDDYYYEK